MFKKLAFAFLITFSLLISTQNLMAQPIPCGTIEADVVLMLDRTGSMGPGDRSKEELAAISFIEAVEASGANFKVSIGRFGDSVGGGTAAEIFVPLTNNWTALKQQAAIALDNNSPGTTNLEDAIEVAQRELNTHGTLTNRVIVLLSDGVANSRDTDQENAVEEAGGTPDLTSGSFAPGDDNGTKAKKAALAAADEAKSVYGIRIITIDFGTTGAGGETARRALAAMASNNSDDDSVGDVSTAEKNQENLDGDDFYLAPSPNDFGDIFLGISGTILCSDGDTCSIDQCNSNTDLCEYIVQDADGDGVSDCLDNCPNNPGKTEPGLCGCEVADTDTDGDGTPNCQDACIDDPTKIIPGICGCGTSDVDTDGDGTVDCQDLCPADPLTTGDTDGDGVADCNDGCVNDPSKTQPGQCGCGVADTDTDVDGVANCLDLCVNDPGKTSPGVCGCNSIDEDTDGDGTANCIDQCPGNPGKIAPGICGCEQADTDTDGDGVANCADACPNDPLKNDAGICGCGISDVNSDGDNAVDCRDACPQDPTKIETGVCGCGVSETDSDGDGAPDCLDLCDADADKTSPGVCGCGTADTDTDGDGKANCEDLCVNDPAKTEGGVCGCGVSDIDTDQDGTANCNDQCPNDSTKASPGECGCGVAEGTCTPTDETPEEPVVPETPVTPDDSNEDETPAPAPTPAVVPGAPVYQVQGSGASCALNTQASSKGMLIMVLMLLPILVVRFKNNKSLTMMVLLSCFVLSGVAQAQEAVPCGENPMDIVIMLDNTQSIGKPSREGQEAALKAALEIIAALPVAHKVGVGRFGIVNELNTPEASYTDAEIVYPLTTDINSILATSDTILDNKSLNGTNLEDAIEAARNELLVNGTSASKFLILVSDGQPNKRDRQIENDNESDSFVVDGASSYDANEQAALAAAQKAKDAGIHVITVGYGILTDLPVDKAGRKLLAAIASSASLKPALGAVDEIERLEENLDGDDLYLSPSGAEIAVGFNLISGSISCDDDDACTSNVCEANNFCNFQLMDGDNDGAADCRDQCVDDASKDAPGICGCGVADTDADKDGYPDCVDACVNDASKNLDAGACGCGVADSDIDGDGVVICLDECADDANKSLPGVCGCGVADTDGDADGVADCVDECPNDALNDTNDNGICDGSETPDNSTTPDDNGTGTGNPTPGVSPAPGVPTAQVQGSGGSCSLNNDAQASGMSASIVLMILALAGFRLKGLRD